MAGGRGPRYVNRRDSYWPPTLTPTCVASLQATGVSIGLGVWFQLRGRGGGLAGRWSLARRRAEGRRSRRPHARQLVDVSLGQGLRLRAGVLHGEQQIPV